MSLALMRSLEYNARISSSKRVTRGFGVGFFFRLLDGAASAARITRSDGARDRLPKFGLEVAL